MRYALILLAVACGGGTSTPSTPASGDGAATERGQRSDTDVAGLEKALADGAQLIDVRTEVEYQRGHVPGAVNVPLGFSADDPRIQSLDASEPIYVICQSGGRSARASDQLAAEGFQAINVEGGTGAWQSAGKPVEK